ncbi:hypothetical protein TM7_0277 [candidate division TM7 genomosp. GTL1]|nr:hypothetical protein TM7_0277 [candidate division TM7 genomosp. GTL1]
MQLEKVKRLLEAFDQGLIPTLHQHEVNPGLPLGGRENYLYFTLPVCINFQRSSPAMWVAALATYQDPATRYVFFPEKLVDLPIEQIRADLMKHKLALQPNKHLLIWTTIAKAFHDFYHDDPRELIHEAYDDAGELIHLLHTSYRKRFPYLSGPKLSNYWPYILSHYTDVKFKNAHAISIIPDTHVLQSSAKLGLTLTNATPLQVELAWKELLKDSGINPTRVHPVLWNWSRNKFQPEV